MPQSRNAPESRDQMSNSTDFLFHRPDRDLTAPLGSAFPRKPGSVLWRLAPLTHVSPWGFECLPSSAHMPSMAFLQQVGTYNPIHGAGVFQDFSHVGNSFQSDCCRFARVKLRPNPALSQSVARHRRPCLSAISATASACPSPTSITAMPDGFMSPCILGNISR